MNPHYVLIFNCLFVAISVNRFVSTTPLDVSRPTTQQLIPSRPIVIVVSFDGFRHSYISPSRTPVLANLTRSGATVPYMIPSFPSKTFPNHHSIATGLYPAYHGVVNNIIFDPRYKAILDGKRDDPRYWKYDDSVLPLWIRNELNGGTSGCVMWPGCSFGYGPESKLYPTYYYPKYNQKLSWEDRVNQAIAWITDDVKPANLVYMYYHEPDSAGHAFGPNDERTLRKVAEADRRYGLLVMKLKRAKMYRKVNLVLLSDHGMSEVSDSRTLAMGEFLSEDLVANIYGRGPLMHVVPKAGRESQLLTALKNSSSSKHFSVFEKDQLCQEPFFYCHSRRIHNYVVLSEPGWNLNRFHEGSADNSRTRVYGTHGYINTDPSMRVFLVGKGPAFKSGYVSSSPVQNIDVVPLLAKLLAISDVPCNGSLHRVDGMLRPI